MSIKDSSLINPSFDSSSYQYSKQTLPTQTYLSLIREIRRTAIALFKVQHQNLGERLFSLSFNYQIHTVDNGQVKEILTHLYQLCCEKRAQYPCEAQRVMAYFLKAANVQRRFPPEVVLFFAKALFLADNDLPYLSLLTQSIGISRNISQAFEAHLYKAKDRLAEIYEMHARSLMQDPSLAYSTGLARELSQFLILSNGIFNPTLIPLLCRTFLRDLEPYSTKKMLESRLTALEGSSGWRAFFESRSSSSLSPLGKHVVRITLGLPYNAPLGIADIKKTLLSGFLTRVRQGDIGSCYATAIAIQVQHLAPERFLRESCEILYENVLSCSYQDKTITVSPLMKLKAHSRELSIRISPQGYVTSKHSSQRPLFVWEAAGIRAACAAIGIKSSSMVFFCKEALRLISSKGRTEISLDIFLQGLAEIAYEKFSSHVSLENLYEQSLFAFRAEVEHPLVSIWENAIAGIIESSSFSSKKRIFEMMQLPIQVVLDRPDIDKLPRNFELLQRWLEEFTLLIEDRLEIQYDPECVYRIKQDTARNSAHVLYDRTPRNSSGNWKKVNTLQKFTKLTLQMIQESSRNLAYSLSLSERRQLKQHVHEVIALIKSKQFLKNIKRNFENPTPKESEKSHSFVYESPWVSIQGKSTTLTLQLYLGKELSDACWVTANGSLRKRITRIIELGRTVSEEVKERWEKDHDYPIPCIFRTVHAASLMIRHPSVAEALKSPLGISKWIKTHVILPGKAIAQYPLTLHMQMQLVEWIASTYIPPKRKYSTFCSRLLCYNKTYTVQEFASKVLVVVKEIFNYEESMMEKVVTKLDSYICNELLPPEVLAKLMKSAFVFCDSNWKEGLHDVYLGCFINPRTSQLQLWQILEDGSKVFTLPQKPWVHDIDWIILKDSDPTRNWCQDQRFYDIA